MDPLTPDEIDPPANVLFADSTVREREPCVDLCHETDESARLTVAVADDQPVTFDSLALAEVDQLLVIGRSVDSPDGLDVTVETIDDPTDLSAIGIAILQFCVDQFEAGTSPEVCFDSLDALLEHVPPNKTVQFALALTERLSNGNAYAHFHLDPSRHEDDFVSNLEAAFDDVVRCDRKVSDAVASETADTETSGSEATDEEIAARFAMRGGASVDEHEPPSFPEQPEEATDEAVATAFDRELDGESVTDSIELDSVVEATDEEIAQAFGTEE
ncbi:hypothetical protein ACLI4Z_17245 [Natrialbaceae archaeon A-arb3/5]